MVLSGVARSESRFACGKNLIAQMLCGSNSAKVKKLRLNQLSTFGLLWQLKQAEVVTLIDILIAIGCLEQEDIDRFRPVLKLTPLGGDVMRGKAELPAGLKTAGRTAAQTAAAGRQVYVRLSSLTESRRRRQSSQRSEVRGQRRRSEVGAGAKPTADRATFGPGARRGRMMMVRPRNSWIIGATVEDAFEGSPGDSFETAETVPTVDAGPQSAGPPNQPPVSSPMPGASAGDGQPAVVLLDLAAFVCKAFRRKSAWRSAESRAKHCWITSSRRRRTAWKSVRPGACRPKRSPRWTQ